MKVLFLSLVVLVSLTLYAEAWEVLIVDAAAEPGQEFQFLSDGVKEIRGQAVNYTQTVTGQLMDDISDQYDVVWLGWNCTSDDGNYFRQDDADVIASYVEAGGVLVTSASDDNGWNSDWLPDEVIVPDTGDYDLEITAEGEVLFSTPNEVGPGDPVMDERYSAIGEEWTILAWGAGMEDSQAGAMQIALGKGLYLLVSIDTRDTGNARLALPLMENMLNYAISYAEAGASVAPHTKLPTLWGKIKVSPAKYRRATTERRD